MFSLILPVTVATPKQSNNLITLGLTAGDNFFFSLFLFLIIVAAATALFYFLWQRKRSFAHSFKFALLRIAVPVVESGNSDPHSPQAKNETLELVREKISIMEQLYATLSNIRPVTIWQKMVRFPYFTLEIAVPFNQEGIAFYMSVPRNQIDPVEKQIHSFFPFVSVEEVKSYNIFTPKGAVSGCTFKLTREKYLPLKTYRDLESDPLNSITNSLSKLDPKKEGAAIQVIVCPLAPGKNKEALDIAREIKQGSTFEQAKAKVSHPIQKLFKGLLDRGLDQKPGSGKDMLASQKDQHILTAGEEGMVESIENKAGKNQFEVNLRLIASAESKERSDAILSHINNSFAQYNDLSLNSFKTIFPKKIKNFIYAYTFRIFKAKRSIVLCTEELASLFHFGINVLKAAPRIISAKSRKAPGPPNLPQEGLTIGKNIYRDQETLVKIEREDRRRHFYTIGQTGTGKSSFMAGLIKQDIENGEGLCVIDPHGELVNKILTFIPEERVKDVVLFDPSDIERPMGLNLLEFSRPEQKTFVINEMIDIFDKLYDMRQVGGPMFEQYMRNAMLLVMAHPESGSTLLEISRVLSDPDFRKFKLDHCSDPVVVNFWVKEAEKAGGEAALANMVPYITSKLTSFIANDVMRPIVAQQKSSFNLREIMDGQKIVLMNLSKGSIGELNAYLLGMVMVGKILISAMSRVDIPEEERKDFYLYIDEFHNFTTDSIVSILSEARKYRLSLIIAHQFLKQLTEKIRDGVFGNVGSLASFRVGPEDAEFVSKQFEPIFGSYDLINLDNFNAYVRLIINGQVGMPFSLSTLPTGEGDKSIAAKVREFSRNTYGRPCKEVEDEIIARLKAGGENVTSPIAAESDMGIK
ncbi:MAG: DUF87 domain-containing protein [Candidatus Moraniibacteriota bacterium]